MATNSMADERSPFRALTRLEAFADEARLLESLLAEWPMSYAEGRAAALASLHQLRQATSADATSRAGDLWFRSLVRFGESGWDMRFVHLALEGRDVLRGTLEPEAAGRVERTEQP